MSERIIHAKIVQWNIVRYAIATKTNCRRETATICPRHVWPWPFELESGVRVKCDVGYLCANFSRPRPLCSRLRPYVRDRQTDVRQHHRLMPPPRGRGITAKRIFSCTITANDKWDTQRVKEQSNSPIRWSDKSNYWDTIRTTSKRYLSLPCPINGCSPGKFQMAETSTSRFQTLV